VFYDVIDGDNTCMSPEFCCSHGFGACRGFDAASGLGTPRFDKLGKYLIPGGLAGGLTPPCFTSGCDVPNHDKMPLLELIALIGCGVVGAMILCVSLWRLRQCCCKSSADTTRTVSQKRAKLNLQSGDSGDVSRRALLSEQEQLDIAIAQSLDASSEKSDQMKGTRVPMPVPYGPRPPPGPPPTDLASSSSAARPSKKVEPVVHKSSVSPSSSSPSSEPSDSKSISSRASRSSSSGRKKKAPNSGDISNVNYRQLKDDAS